MGDSAHTTHHTNQGKKSAPPLFLEDENIFQKSASVVPWEIEFPKNHGGRFLENVLILEKRGGADAFENDPPFRSKGTVDLEYCSTLDLYSCAIPGVESLSTKFSTRG